MDLIISKSLGKTTTRSHVKLDKSKSFLSKKNLCYQRFSYSFHNIFLKNSRFDKLVRRCVHKHLQHILINQLIQIKRKLIFDKNSRW